jgi:transposase-like protein
MITEDQLREFNRKLKDVKSADELIGRDGLITDLFKDTLQNMMEAELTHTLGYPKGAGSRTLKGTSNKRNGHSQKTVRSSMGEVALDKPRDRNGEFSPKILEQYEGGNTNELERKVISMYGRGMTVADCNEHLADMYGISVSDGMISEITNKILPEVQEWRTRPLSTLYPIVYADAIHYKVREDGRIKTKAVYVIIGVDISGKKDVLGIWIGEEAESAKFWLKVFQDVQARGANDILIFCSDNLSGFSEAVKAVFPEVIIQKCVIHQIRNSMKYIATKDKHEFMADLKKIYKSDTKDEAERNLIGLEDKWGEKYGIVVKSWQNNWEELSAYFDFSPEIRKMIYTTNMIESLNRNLRKVTKNRSVFPNETSLLKLLYLATKNTTKKWTVAVPNWGKIIAQLHIHFGDRVKLDL